MHDKELLETLAGKLVRDFCRHERHASMQVGKVTIYVYDWSRLTT